MCGDFLVLSKELLLVGVLESTTLVRFNICRANKEPAISTARYYHYLLKVLALHSHYF